MPAPTHAPTPYTLSPSGTIIRDANLNTIAVVPSSSMNGTASFIGRACSCHHELIRAIETLVAEWEHAHGPLPDDHRAKVALANARRAGK